jgi:hypothetical protein
MKMASSFEMCLKTIQFQRDFSFSIMALTPAEQQEKDALEQQYGSVFDPPKPPWPRPPPLSRCPNCGPAVIILTQLSFFPFLLLNGVSNASILQPPNLLNSSPLSPKNG